MDPQVNKDTPTRQGPLLTEHCLIGESKVQTLCGKVNSSFQTPQTTGRYNLPKTADLEK